MNGQVTLANIFTVCKGYIDLSEKEANYIMPWCKRGKIHIKDCQIHCKEDNRRKSGK